jgi:dTDP-4-dehydrorhamnose 3,5-epimerase
MKFEAFEFGTTWIVHSEIHRDQRGEFRETFRRDKFRDVAGLDFQVEQTNCSTSSRGVLRGIHYSMANAGQAKWVSCLKGEIEDYVVDLRPHSPTFKKWKSVRLSATNSKSIILQSGVGHAFEALEDECIVSYSLTSAYDPSSEMTISPFDPQLNIGWHFEAPGISDRDRFAPTLEEQLSRGFLPSDNLPL